ESSIFGDCSRTEVGRLPFEIVGSAAKLTEAKRERRKRINNFFMSSLSDSKQLYCTSPVAQVGSLDPSQKGYPKSGNSDQGPVENARKLKTASSGPTKRRDP